KECDARRAQAEADLAREQDGLGDTSAVLGRLAEERRALFERDACEADIRGEAARALQSAAEALARAQERFDEAIARFSDLAARRAAASRTIEELRRRIARLDDEAAAIALKQQALMAQSGAAAEGERLALAVEAASYGAG